MDNRLSALLVALLLIASSGCERTPSRLLKPDGELIASGRNFGYRWEMYFAQGSDSCLSMWIPGGHLSSDSCGFDIPDKQQVTYSAFGPFDEGMILYGAFDESAEHIRLLFANGQSVEPRLIQESGMPVRFFVTTLPPDFNGGLKGVRLIINGQEVTPKEDRDR